MKLIKEKCCCFTGHRRVPELECIWIRRRLREAVVQLYELGVDTFLAGGALGFDTMAAQEVLRMRNIGYPVRLVLVLPCPGQEEKWPPHSVTVYYMLMQEADEVIYLDDYLNRETLLRRDRYMVDNSCCCVCYLTQTKGRRGGTIYTVNYAKKQGIRLIYLVNQPRDENALDIASLLTQNDS